MKKTLLMASLLFLSTGWAIEFFPTSGQAETRLVAQQPAGDNSGVSASSKSPQFQLLAPGSEPRQQLRYKPNIDVNKTTTLAVKMEMESATADKSLNVTKVPTMVLTMDTKATKIDDFRF
jgi:hypothetical protein